MRDLLVRLDTLPARAPALREGYRVKRAEAVEKTHILEWIGQHFSAQWASEAELSFARRPIACFIALYRDQCVGFACYEAKFRGVFGPTGVEEGHRGKALGTVLLLASLRAMADMGYAYAVIGGVGPKAFYAKTVGAIEIPAIEIP